MVFALADQYSNRSPPGKLLQFKSVHLHESAIEYTYRMRTKRYSLALSLQSLALLSGPASIAGIHTLHYDRSLIKRQSFRIAIAARTTYWNCCEECARIHGKVQCLTAETDL